MESKSENLSFIHQSTLCGNDKLSQEESLEREIIRGPVHERGWPLGELERSTALSPTAWDNRENCGYTGTSGPPVSTFRQLRFRPARF